MNKKQIRVGAIGLLFTVAGVATKLLLREFGDTGSIRGMLIADGLPCVLFVVGFSQLLLIKPPFRPGIVIAMVTLASFLFEIGQYYSYGATDYLNIFASVTGGIISWFIWKQVDKKIVEG